jgi:ribosome-associated protein
MNEHGTADDEWIDDGDRFSYDNVRGPSKSARKRESHSLQDLGEVLVRLSDEVLDALDLSEGLREALTVAKGISAHGGYRRQMKYIGKLLRAIDSAPIHEKLAELRGEGVRATRLHHESERWRDDMLIGGLVEVDKFLGIYPEAERQKLRSLVIGAQGEKASDKPPRSSRLLFKYIREILTDHASGGAGADVFAYESE